MSKEDRRATSDAIDLLYQLRLRYGTQIPMFFWKMVARAEKRLSDQLAREPFTRVPATGV